MTYLPTPEDLEEMTRDVWTSFLDGDGSQLLQGDGVVPEERVTGCVHLSGAYSGSVMVQCSDSAARDAAAALFAMETADVTPSEVTDALGEIANMVGGNVKSLLPGPSALSLPAVAQGQHSSLSVPGSRVVQQVHLLWRAEPMVVSLWKHEA